MGRTLLLSLVFTLFPLFVRGDDLDRDGLDDALEETLARSFMPWTWYWLNESCPEPGVILYHARPYAPGGSTDTLAITYLIAYYEDCGSFGHAFDYEPFSVTLYPLQGSPSGYGAHAITTWYHQGSPLYGCPGQDSRIFGTPRPDLGTTSDTTYASWDTLFVSDDKHAPFLSEGACDDGCYGSDECAPELVMNDGRLVPPEEGQFFHLFNIGQINDPLIENFTDINQMGGFTFDPRHIWGDPSIDERYYWVSDGPPSDVYFTATAFPYPNPVRRCQDQSVGIDTWYKSLFRVRVSTTTGQTLREEYLGEFCWSGDDDRLHLWDGEDSFGDCLTSGPKLVELSAIRGADVFSRTFEIEIAGDELPGPEAPSGLTLDVVDGHVEVGWMDNSDDEDGFVIERRRSGCAYVYLTTPGPHPGTGMVQFDDYDVDVDSGETYGYRVSTSGEGGFSATIEGEITPSGLPPVHLQADCLNPGDPSHHHMLSWTFNYTNPDRFQDYTVEYRYLWQGSGLGEAGEWTAWDTLATIDNLLLTWYEHDDVNTGGCYQYRVRARVDGGSTADNHLVDHGYDCQPPDPSGCPYLYVWDGETFVPENNLLPFSEVSVIDHVDYCPLVRRPVPWNGRIVLEIREDDRESSSIDAVRLLRADHLPSLQAGITPEGTVFEYAQARSPLAAVDGRGKPCLDLLTVPEGEPFRGTGGSTVNLTFNLSGPGIVVLTRVPEPGIKSVGPIITRPRPGRGSGPPDIVGTGMPRHAGGEQFFEIPSPAPPGGDLSLSLSWIDPVAVDFIGLIDEWTEITPQDLPLVGAVHSRWGDIAADLLEPEGRRVTLDPGQRIRLEYAAPKVPKGRISDYFLVIEGHYEKPEGSPARLDGGRQDRSRSSPYEVRSRD